MDELTRFLQKIGMAANQHVLLHSAFRAIKKQFPQLTIENFIRSIKNIIGEQGSLIIPTFTYCYRRKSGPVETYHKKHTKSRLGAVSETFRNMRGITRTASPTHSFALWGMVRKDIPGSNAPTSPLGKGSVMEWLAEIENSYICLLGVDFKALSFGHYLEVIARVPWVNISPWDYLNVEPAGISEKGEQNLTELPGCSKGFVRFQEFLQRDNKLNTDFQGDLSADYIPVKLLISEGVTYFSKFPETLLCPPESCPACDERWAVYLCDLTSGLRDDSDEIM